MLSNLKICYYVQEDIEKEILSYKLGFKFHTEEWSMEKKTYNCGVWVNAGTGDGEFDYYDVIHEILELEFTGHPKKKLVLFRCKWFDLTPLRGKRVHLIYKIVEVNQKRRYAHYDQFIIA